MAANAGRALFAFADRRLTPAPPIAQQPQVTPPAPGFAPYSQTPHDFTHQRELLRTYEAMFGKVTTRLGPTNPRWSTVSGEFKPEDITGAIDQANAGFPFRFCDMLRRAVENDAHMEGCVLQAFSGIVAKEASTEPPPTLARDAVAQSIAHWQRACREQVQDLDGARFALLWAEAQGYSAAEIIWGWRRITWYRADGRRISKLYLVPVKLEIVEGRAFRFDIETDEPLLWLDSDYSRLPPGKFIFHVARGISQIRERRGFGRSALYLHAIKQWAVRDAAVYMHLYGLNQLIVSYNSKHYQYPEYQASVSRLIKEYGQGGILTVPADLMKLDAVSPPPQNALVHTQFADWLNGEMTKSITAGGPLQMAAGGGSYGLGDVHAEGAFYAQVLRAKNLCDTETQDLWWPNLQLNQWRLLEDLADLPGVWVTADDILAALPVQKPQIERTADPEKKQKIFSQAMRDGCTVSLTQYRASLQIDQPKDEADTLEGEGVAIPSSGGVVPAVQASKGVLLPQPDTGQPAAPANPPIGQPQTKSTAAQSRGRKVPK